MEKKRLLSLIIILMILVVIIGAILLSVDDPKQITANEGYILANKVMNETHTTYYLYRIQNNMMETYEDGKSTGWSYGYLFEGNNETFHYKRVEIYSNGSYISYDLPGTTSSLDKLIQNWSIDSDAAYKIAASNPAINSFINSPSCSFFGSYMIQINGTTQWCFSWNKAGILDDPKWADINIDATTGEVLYVEVDD